MNLGFVFYLIALLLYFCAGSGLLIPYTAAMAWGSFSLVLGLLLSGVSLNRG